MVYVESFCKSRENTTNIQYPHDISAISHKDVANVLINPSGN